MRKNKIILLFLVMMLLCNFVLFNDVAKADSVYSLDYGWEDKYPSGTTSGSIGLIDFENKTGDPSFNITSVWKNTGNFGFTVDWVNGLGWWNLTTGLDYISEFSWYGMVVDTNTRDLVMNIYDGDDIAIKLTYVGGGHLYATGVTLGYYSIYNNLDGFPDDEYYIEIEHNYTNIFECRLYNNTDVLIDTSLLEGFSSEIWDTFDSIEFVTTAGGANTNTQYFDDFNITTSSESEYETCMGDVINIEKRFNNSLVGYDDTVWFRIYEDWDGTGPVYPNWNINIINSVGAVVQSDVTSSYDFLYDFTPRSYMGLGTYYIRAKLTISSTWDVSCPFTVQEESINPVLDDWQIYTDKYFYDDEEDVNVYYKIPVGYNGHIIVTLNGAYYDQSYNISGNIQTRIFDWIAMGEGNIWGFQLYRYNDTALMNSTSIEVKTGFTDWELFVNNGFETSVFAGDENTPVIIRYAYEGMDNKLYLAVYNNTTYNSSTFERSWELTDGENSGSIEWYPRNYTVGMETFYVVLEYDIEHQLDDGINRIVYVFDKEVVEPVPPPEGEGWYGLPFWVQYLIGIFLTLFITMSPLIIGTYISRNTRMTKVSIPPLLYVGFFFFGLIVSVLMDFLPSWLPFVILFGMITFFAVQWLYGKKGEIAGE